MRNDKSYGLVKCDKTIVNRVTVIVIIIIQKGPNLQGPIFKIFFFFFFVFLYLLELEDKT